MTKKHNILLAALGIAIFCSPAVLVLRSSGTFLVLSHIANGRTGNCTSSESFEGAALNRLQAANGDEIRKTSRVVRREGQLSLWSTPAGEYWMPTASRDALIYDLAEQKRNIYGTKIHAGDIVLDAGANVGVFTRKALWSGAAKVVAIEPAPENLECLRRNLAGEIADGRVVIYPKGIWDRDDVLKLSVDPVNSAADTFVRQISNARFVEVPLTTVDQMVQELRLPRVDFIKMDIEGAEQKAITGAQKTIASFRPRMALSIYHVNGDETMVPKLVHKAVPDYTVTKTCLCATNRVVPEVAFFD